MKKVIQPVLIATVAVIVSACSTVGVIVPVTKPAEINLKGKNEIIVNDIVPGDPGNSDLVRGGQILADMVREGLAESNFKIIDRNHLGSIMAELQLGSSDLASPEGQAKLGKIMTGSVMVSGRMDNYDAGDKVTGEKRECTRYEGDTEIRYRCVVYTRTAGSNVRASFNVIDVASAQNLKTKVLTCKNSATTKATDAVPDEIDLDALREECARQVAADFNKVIAPWTQHLKAFFQKDGSLPTLETGIQYAQAGDWESAIANFQKAIDEAATNPKIKPKAAAYAHWNMGLALEFTGKFDEAIVHVKKAYEISNNKDYLGEIDNIKKMKADQAKLEEQQRDSGASSHQ